MLTKHSFPPQMLSLQTLTVFEAIYAQSLHLKIRRDVGSLFFSDRGVLRVVSANKAPLKCRERFTSCGSSLYYRRCRRTVPTCPLKHAESWASQATCCAAPVTYSGSSASPSCSLTADSAVSRRPRWKRASSTPGPSSRCVDENWGGSLKSKLLSGATSRRRSKVFRSST